MKVFLTGGTGYLGEHVARALLEAGHEVTALARSPERGAALRGGGATVVLGDLEDSTTWAEALDGMEGLVHTAAVVESWSADPERFDRINVVATLDLLDRARAFGIPRVVVTGTLFALGPSAPGAVRDEHALDLEPGAWSRANDYVRTRTAVSRKIRERQRRGGPVMTAIPTVLLGPGRRTRGNHTARVLDEIGRRRFPGLVGSGAQVWNLVPVARAARGHVLALERGRPGENYLLGGENWSERKLVEEAARAFGVRPPLTRLGTGVPLAVGAACELWAGLTGRAPYLTRGEVRLYRENWAVSSEKARRELGYEAGGVDAVLAETVAWLRDEVWPRR